METKLIKKVKRVERGVKKTDALFDIGFKSNHLRMNMEEMEIACLRHDLGIAW
jgi:hypothetical protein